MADPTRLEVGRILKAHGLRGEVVVSPITPRLERFGVGSVLYLDGNPVTVATNRPHQQRLLLGFEGVHDRSAAEQLRGRVLTADTAPGPADEGEFWVHELVGCEVVTADGRVCGRVDAVEENPAHDLLVLDTGALVPIVFVVEHTDGRIVIAPPDGLLDA